MSLINIKGIKNACKSKASRNRKLQSNENVNNRNAIEILKSIKFSVFFKKKIIEKIKIINVII